MIPATSEALRRASDAQLRNQGLGGLTGNHYALEENARYRAETDEVHDRLKDERVMEASYRQIEKEGENL